MMRRFFSTSLVKTLRQVTGAPVMDCKIALEQSNNDLEKAKLWIFEKSKSVAAKISSRTAKEGLIGLSVSDKVGALSEINCETDFVARNVDFQTLVRQQTDSVLKTGKGVEPDVITGVSGRVRENIVVAGTLRLESKANTAVLGCYLHNQLGEGVGTSGAIVSLKHSGDIESARKIARALAVQIVGTKPLYISRNHISKEDREKEEKKIVEELGDVIKGKPEKAKASIIQGKMQKFYGDRCLLDQAFILGEFEGKPVKESLGSTLSVEGFIRMNIGGDSAKSE